MNLYPESGIQYRVAARGVGVVIGVKQRLIVLKDLDRTVADELKKALLALNADEPDQAA